MLGIQPVLGVHAFERGRTLKALQEKELAP